MGFTTIRKVPHERSWGTTELERRFGIERARAMQERCACSARNFSLFVLIWVTEDGWSDSDVRLNRGANHPTLHLDLRENRNRNWH
jgi:hypothetical protein